MWRETLDSCILGVVTLNTKNHNMDSPDLGSPGCWIFGLIMAIVGVISTVVLLVVGIVWLINHIHIY